MSVFTYLHNVKDQPEHVRKQVALVIAGAVTGVIAVLWLATNLVTGSFAIAGTSFDQSTAAVVQTSGADQTNTQLLGAASASTPPSQQANIRIVDTTQDNASAKVQSAEPTLIPF